MALAGYLAKAPGFLHAFTLNDVHDKAYTLIAA